MVKNKIDMKYTIIRQNLSHRGGGIEIALDNFGFEDEKMTAYQNYLGGGMLGRILNDCTINGWSQNDKLVEIAEDLSQYLFSLTNDLNDDCFAREVFEHVQRRPSSGY
mgnify:FL=1|tara:strand:+ start:62 stop:385 length:324 start_codon:yes stop_codon:yes gene_type:complete